MLNEADSYQGGGSAGAEASEPVKDAEALFRKLKRFVKADYNSKGQVNWRREAREDFDFEAGDQLNDEDKTILQDAKRPIVIFNRLGTTLDSVAGHEVGNRQEVQFLPRRQGVVKKSELLTSAAKWFRQQCDVEDEESDALRDMVVCGMGWTETRLGYEVNPEGDPKVTGPTTSVALAEVRYWQIVLKNSKTTRLRKSRKCSALVISAAARLRRTGASARDRFCGN